MKLIIIIGPSGSGKTTISKKILQKIGNGKILNTDNYYKTGIISLILSKIVNYYFDRKISFNFQLFKRDLDFILKNGYSNFYYKYDFKKKSIKKIYKKSKNIRFIIIEGIFAKEIIKKIPTNNFILIKLNTNKKTCMRRVIKRDSEERGKTKFQAKRDFLNAWELFHKNNNKRIFQNYLKKIIIKKGTVRKKLIRKIISTLN